ncbi:hypothetical protein [Streptomyces sp. NPDC096339]|uniref:hypothetical protein n=1 Tax=Streptomyces sp. NPDC096339 TaxID=3366086 RepID=UPI0038194776
MGIAFFLFLLVGLVVAATFLLIGLVVAVTPGVVVGYAFVAMSRRLSLGVRIPALLVVAAGTGALWTAAMGAIHSWGVIAIGLTSLATLASGAAFLGLEAAKRRVRRYPHPQWPGWYPPAAHR